MNDSFPELEQKIISDLRNWSKNALEIPNEHYNNLPACPFAKAAWINDKVGFVFNYLEPEDLIYSCINDFDDSKDVVILVDFFPMDLDEMDIFLDDLNQDISQGKYNTKDLYLMGFHPEDENNELLDDSLDMEEDSTPSYAMIFFQRLSKLQEASDSLRVKGYYNICEDYYDAGSLYERRKSIYRRLKNGNEKS
jgi:hypothetical protein|tara:strand:- start:126 stop:707 length:582 start_codon:yes stop_codon:yes gene_type:complete